MNDIDDLITLVIHTPERAQRLKNILDEHGVAVKLEDFRSFKSAMAVAQRVKIYPRDLPLALRIIESGDEYSPALVELSINRERGGILVPVDFSPASSLAVKIGMQLGAILSEPAKIMHSYVSPLLVKPNTDEFPELDGEEVESSADVRKVASRKLRKFKTEIEEMQSQGELSEIEFSTQLLEGVAEEAILEYCRVSQPRFVVMATRGRIQKEEELVGSVTAEVLDSCRVPVFTVPDNGNVKNIKEIEHLLFFCNMDQHDVIAIDSLMRLFQYPKCKIILVPASHRKGANVERKMNTLSRYFNSNFPNGEFEVELPGEDEFRLFVDAMIQKHDIELLVLPNKKTNIFTRIFHPTIAHKFVFERDMPMLVLPV